MSDSPLFKLKQAPTFFRAVELKTIDGEPTVLQAEFRFLPRSQLLEFIGEINRVEKIEEAEGGAALDELVRRVVCGWRDADAAFSPEALTELLENYPASPRRFVGAFLDAYKAAAAKN